MDENERKQLQELLRELLVWKEDFVDNQKTLSNLENRFNALYDKIDARLDGVNENG